MYLCMHIVMSCYVLPCTAMDIRVWSCTIVYSRFVFPLSAIYSITALLTARPWAERGSSVFAILREFLTDLCDWRVFFGCLIEASFEIQRKIICWGKQELARTCSVYISVNLWLCDWRDYYLLLSLSFIHNTNKLNFDFYNVRKKSVYW